jgi:hypothetical protein
MASTNGSDAFPALAGPKRVVFDNRPDLLEADADDRDLMWEVISYVLSLRHPARITVDSWTVTATETNYRVDFVLESGISITSTDTDRIRAVNRYRVSEIEILPASPSSMHLVLYFEKKGSCMVGIFEETIIHVKKRARLH